MLQQDPICLDYSQCYRMFYYCNHMNLEINISAMRFRPSSEPSLKNEMYTIIIKTNTQARF